MRKRYFAKETASRDIIRQMRKVLIFSEDKDLCDSLESYLKETCLVRCMTELEKVIDHLRQKSSDILVIDNDSDNFKGIESYKTIRSVVPRVKTIMLSRSPDVSFAVNASKLGVLDYLNKPLPPERVLESINKILGLQEDLGAVAVPEGAGIWWQGTSLCIRDFLDRIKESGGSDKNILLVLESGMSGEQITRVIHENSLNKKRKFVSFDLASFEKESSEAMFWNSIKQLLADNPDGFSSSSDYSGTIYLNGFDVLPAHFKTSILNFLNNKRGEKIDSTIRIVLGAGTKQGMDGFIELAVPPLRDRKEDIPILVKSLVEMFASKYGKTVKGADFDVFDILLSYDWPGNYEELSLVIESSVLKCQNGIVSLCDVPVDFKMVLAHSLRKAIGSSDLSLTSSQSEFKKTLVETLSAYSSGNIDPVAKLLDVPKTLLE